MLATAPHMDYNAEEAFRDVLARANITNYEILEVKYFELHEITPMEELANNMFENGKKLELKKQMSKERLKN